MKFFPLVWAMLWRSRARTTLTFLTIVVAFLLFGLISAVENAFMAGVRIAADDTVIVTYRQGLVSPLPYAHMAQIEKVYGVKAVGAVMVFSATYQDPKNQLNGGAIEPASLTEVDPRVAVAPEQLDAFRNTRTGMLVGNDLVEKYGWKIGDRIPLTIPAHRKDGTQNWEFDVVGTFDFDERITGQEARTEFVLIQYDHWNESVQYPNYVIWFRVRLDDAARSAEVARAIDRLFLNSEWATRTQPEREFQAGFLRQMGNISAMAVAVISAVFFTLILIAGNAMMQAYRERIPELGVLKTVGFTDGRLALLVALESTALCLVAGAVGTGLSLLATPLLQKANLPVIGVQGMTVAAGIALAAGIGLVSALIPSGLAARLTVSQALARP